MAFVEYPPPKWPNTCLKPNKMAYTGDFLKTSSHFQDPPKRAPQRGPKKRPQEEAQNSPNSSSQGNPPTGPKLFWKLNKLAYICNLLKTSRHFQDQKEPLREAPKRDPRKRRKIAPTALPKGPPPNWPNTVLQMNKMAYTGDLLKTSRHVQDPPKEPPREAPKRNPKKRPKIAPKALPRGTPQLAQNWLGIQ